MTKRKYRTDEEWLSLIQECRLSGLTDKQWCETHQICPSNFYYQIQKFRISKDAKADAAILVQINGFQIGITNAASESAIFHTLSALHRLC